MYVYPRVYQATMCTNKHKPNRCTDLSWILGSFPITPPPPSGNEAAFVQLVSPPGWRYFGVCPHWAACPLPSGGWRYSGLGSFLSPPPPCTTPAQNTSQNLMQKDFVFKNKNPYNRIMGFLCAYASFTWKEEIEGQNIVALDEFTYARKPGRLHSKRQFIT